MDRRSFIRFGLGVSGLALVCTPGAFVAEAIGADGPAFLGPAYAPFDPAGQARRNMDLAVSNERLHDRRRLPNPK